MGMAWLVEFSPGAWQEHFLSSSDAALPGRFCFLHVLLLSEYVVSRLNSLEQWRYWSPVPSRSYTQEVVSLLNSFHVMKPPRASCFVLFSATHSVSLDPTKWKMAENPQVRHDHVRKERQHLCTTLPASSLTKTGSHEHSAARKPAGMSGCPMHTFNYSWRRLGQNLGSVVWLLPQATSHSMAHTLHIVGTQQMRS